MLRQKCVGQIWYANIMDVNGVHANWYLLCYESTNDFVIVYQRISDNYI
jgi:hypothetical protein